MAASISTKRASVAAEFMKKTAGYITGAAGDYIKEAMPTTTSTIGDARSEFTNVKNKFGNMTSSISQTAKAMKRQGGLKRVLDWYLDKDKDSNIDDSLTFDTVTSDDSSDIANEQIGETERSANKITSAVLQSNQHLLEGQMELSANIMTSLDKQTAVITAGFDKVNSTLNELLKVVTKNTATIIETSVAASKSNDKAMGTGRFDLNSYKNMVMKNIKSDPTMGMALSMIPLLSSGVKLSPQDFLSMGFSGFMDKKAPNLKANLKAFDSAINEMIMNSLIRLGESNKDFFGLKLGKIFGIDSSRKEHGGSRSTLELKNIPYNSLANDYITNAIPGYLQRILVQLGGPNVTYDARSRQFRSQGAMRRDFNRASAGGNALGSASGRIQEAFGNDQYGRMMYDILLTDLGGKSNRAAARTQANNFNNPGEFEKYMINLLRSSGVVVDDAQRRRIQDIGRGVSSGIGDDIMNHAARNNIERNKRMSQYISEAEAYNVDLSKMRSGVSQDIKQILQDNGMISSGIGDTQRAMSSGTGYTNKALYEIHRLLSRGINVFQVGSDNSIKKAYDIEDRSYKLAPPTGMKSRPAAKQAARTNPSDIYESNPMFGKAVDAIKNSDQVQNMKDKAISKIKGFGKDINDRYGNVIGYLKHKVTGTGYSYTDENGNVVNVKDNEAGGIMGFMKSELSSMFGNAKKSVGNWFNSVKGYFDYGDSSPDGRKVASKRSKLIASSVGALAGAGILGGPIGLIMGGLAGASLPLDDLGDKIKDMFIGRDKDGKPTGILTRLGDKVIDPIKYQFAKTFHHLGNTLKKNIIGPLSDIGLAIKDRITAAVHGESKTVFGKVFGFVGKMMMGAFKKATDLFHLPAKLLGGVTRGAISGGTGLVGFGLESIARSIAGRTATTEIDPETGEERKVKTRDKISSRAKDRKAEYKKNKDFMSFDEFQKASQEKRAEMLTRLQHATAEESEVIASNTSEIKDDVSTLTKLGSEKGSIFTHDEGIHERLDAIIESITGKKRRKGSKGKPDVDTGMKPSSANITNAAVQTAATIATEGNLTNDDAREFNAIMSEAEKDKPSQSVLRTRLNKLFKSQEKDKTEEKKEKNSLWDILKSVASSALKYLPYIAGIAGIISFIHNIISNWSFGNTVEHLADNVKEAAKTLFFGDNDDKTSTVTEGANSVLALTDSKVKSIVNLADLGGIYHNKNAANGDWVRDQGKTAAKNNYLYTVPFMQSITQPAWNTIKSEKTFNQALKAEAAGKTEKADALLNKSSELAESAADAKQHAGSNLVHGAARNFARVGVMSAAGTAVGSLAGHVGSSMGLTDEQSQNLGNIATRGTVAALMINQGTSALKGKKSIVDTMLDLIKKALDVLSSKLKSFSKLKAFAKKIDTLFDNIYNATVGKMTTKLATMIATKIAAAGGKATVEEVAAALTLGITIAVAGIAGIISGVCDTEHLFGILPGKADGTMKAIAGFVKGAFEALEAVPGVGIIIAAFDVIDEFIFKNILIDQNGLGHTLKSYLATWLYGLLKGQAGAEDLALKQKALAEEKDYYNEKYGVEMDTTTFNDMVNTGGLFDKIWRGNNKYDENGHLKFDAAGGRIAGGISGWLTGGEKQYVFNADGTVMKDENGNAVVARDAKGNVMTVSGKGAGARAWNSVKRFFGGGDIYEVDENGQAKVDANGNYIVAGKEKNIFGKAGDMFKTVGKGIVSFGKKAGEFAVSGFNAAKDGVSKLWSFVKDGDISGLWQSHADDNEQEGDITGKLMEGIYTIGKLYATTPTVVSWAGHKVVDFFKSLPQKIKNSFSSLKTNYLKIGSYVSNGDPSGLMQLDFTEDKDNPVGGFTRGIFHATKIVNVPIAGIKWLGTTIVNGIKSIPAKIKNSFTALSTNHSKINDLAKGGNVEDLVTLNFDDDEENPVGGITKAIFTIDKFMNVPKAGLHWVGNKIKDVFVKAVNTIKDAKSGLDKNVATIHDKAYSGDISGLTAVKYTENSENPLNGLMHGLFSITKVFNYPRAMIHWVGNKIKAAFDNIGDAFTENKSSLDSATDRISSYSSDGDIGMIWSTSVTWNTNDPLRFIWGAALTMSKLWNTFAGIIPWLGKKIAQPINDIKDWFSDTFSWIPGVGGSNTSTTHTSSSGITHGGGGRGRGGPKDILSDGMNMIDVEGNTISAKDIKANRAAAKARLEQTKKNAANTTSGTVTNTSSTETVNSALSGNPMSKEFKVTSGFGSRFLNGKWEGHDGIDLVPSDGSKIANAVSTVSGTVSAVKTTLPDSHTGLNVTSDTGGNYVLLKSDDGTIRKYFHLKHNTIPSGIKKGTRVSPGTILGQIGTTGRSTGVHLHYGIFESDNKTPIDPTSYIYGSPLAGTSIASSSDSYSTDSFSSALAMETVTTDVSTEEDKGFLAKLSDFVTGIGSKFLSLITGGLYGSSSSSSSSSINDAISSSGVGMTAQDFINLISKELGTAENPPGSNNVKYNTWFYGKSVTGSSYPWCMAFVQWCFNEAGFPLPFKTASCVSLYDYYVKNDPGRIHTTNPKVGDIFLFRYASDPSHGHTGIVRTVSGNTFTTIEGNWGDKVASRTTSTSAKDFLCFVTAVDFGTLSQMNTASLSSAVANGDLSSLWKYFKSLGYSDAGVAGLLGCWQAESSGRSKVIEGQYLTSLFNQYGGYNMINDRASMDAYTKELYYNYLKKKTPIDDSYYGATKDGHYYPGIGFAQWTGPRAKRLLEYAQANNADWSDASLQLRYMEHEMSTSYPKVAAAMKTATNVNDATKAFMVGYEGNKETAVDANGVTYLSKRQKYANQIYSQYRGVGGPIEPNSRSAIRQSTYVARPTRSTTNVNTAYGVGGPTSTTKVVSTPMRSVPNVSIVPSGTSGGTDLTGVVTLMARAVDELIKITNNTASSTTYLESINDKDFVDQGLRDSIDALKNVKRAQKSTPLPSSPATAVLEMASP